MCVCVHVCVRLHVFVCLFAFHPCLFQVNFAVCFDHVVVVVVVVVVVCVSVCVRFFSSQFFFLFFSFLICSSPFACYLR